MERDGYTCQECGTEVGSEDSEIPTANVHHIEPISEGGSNEKENLITLCTGCHEDKHVTGIGRTSEAITVISRATGKEIELIDTDVNILDELKKGRNTPTNLSRRVDISRNYASARLKRLVEHDYVEKPDRGLYELVSDPRDEEDTET
jgi:DNA-binding transcriptional ArsR family regulator